MEPRDALDLYASIFEDHPLGYFLLDNQQFIIKANKAFAHLLGYQPGDLIGKSMATIVELSAIEDQREMAAALHSGKINDLDLEGNYLSASGELVFCRSLIKAVFDEDHHLKYCVATVLDLRKTRETESHLRNSKELWDTAYDNASFSIAFIDPESMQFVDANQAFVKTVGYELAELLQLSPLDISPEFQPGGVASLELAKKYLAAAIAGQSPRFDWHHKHKNGEDRFFLIHLDHVVVEDGLRILALAEDISERIKQENSIRLSEERFRNLYHRNPLMLFTIDMKGKVLALNRAAIKQLGYREEEMLNREIKSFFHPDDQEKICKKVTAFASDSSQETSWQLRKRRKDGSVLYVKELIKKIKWSEQDALLIACENITDQMRAERIRKESEEKYRMIFDNNFLGITITGASGQFEMVNPALCEMLGYTQEELLQLDMMHIVDDSNRQDMREMLQMRASKNAAAIENKYRKKDGSALHARTMFRWLPSEKPTGKALAMIWDISPEKKLQEQHLEISAKTQELTTYALFLTQKNELLRQLTIELQELSEMVQPVLNLKLRKVLNRIEQDINTENTWVQFQKHFQSANPKFLSNLRDQYPNLTVSEQRHCALVVMALSNAEVANLLHVTPKAVEVARYRLKKKFELRDRNAKLSQFLQQFL